MEQLEWGSTYKIQWEDGKTEVQHSINIFGYMTRSRSFRKGDYILAPMTGKQQRLVKYFTRSKNLHASYYQIPGP